LADSNSKYIFNPSQGTLSRDKDAKACLYFMFDISGELVVSQEEKYTGSTSIGVTLE